MRFAVAGLALAALACGNDLEPCEEQVESFDDLVGTWETVSLGVAEPGGPASSWYGWLAFNAYHAGRVTIGADGGVTVNGWAWDDTLYVEYDVVGIGALTLDGDSVTLAWSTVDPALLAQRDIVLQFPITFGVTLRNGWPEYDDWGLFETVECRATSQRWLELRADSTAARMDPELAGRWMPAVAEWTLVTPAGAVPWR